MAKSSGIGDLIGWGIAGVGIWWVGSMYNWFGLFGTPAAAPTGTGTPAQQAPTATSPTTTTTPVTTTSPVSTAPPSVSLAGTVSTTLNNALEANVDIGGAVQNLACIPGGQCYNTSGQGVTLPSGVTAAQIYALMQTAYAAQTKIATTTTTKSPAATSTTTVKLPTSHGATVLGVRGLGMGAGIIPASTPMPVTGPRLMTRSSRRNYVRKGAAY
jgi:hypothetical protein